jgi:S-adenosylmethionine hydrolase
MRGVAPSAPLVTLSGDIGAAYAAQMKAVLYRSLPPGSVVELDVDLPAHAIREAAFLLLHMARRFPAATVHLAIVDPGVGGRRRPIVIRCGATHLVGPDNGLLAPLADALGAPRAFRIDPSRVPGGGAISATFHGRDLFAPVAAALALGTAAEAIGTPGSFHRLRRARPTRAGGRVRAEILHVDRFGNAITNVPSAWAPGLDRAVRLQVGSSPPRRVARRATYESIRPGEVALVVSSFELVEIAMHERPAATTLGLAVGARIAWTESSAASARRAKMGRPARR